MSECVCISEEGDKRRSFDDGIHECSLTVEATKRKKVQSAKLHSTTNYLSSKCDVCTFN